MIIPGHPNTMLSSSGGYPTVQSVTSYTDSYEYYSYRKLDVTANAGDFFVIIAWTNDNNQTFGPAASDGMTVTQMQSFSYSTYSVASYAGIATSSCSYLLLNGDYYSIIFKAFKFSPDKPFTTINTYAIDSHYDKTTSINTYYYFNDFSTCLNPMPICFAFAKSTYTVDDAYPFENLINTDLQKGDNEFRACAHDNIGNFGTPYCRINGYETYNGSIGLATYGWFDVI